MGVARSRPLLARLLANRPRPAAAAPLRALTIPVSVAVTAGQPAAAPAPEAAPPPAIAFTPAATPAASTEVYPTRVLLVANDRRFRAAACTLLSQRGYTVVVCRRSDDIAESAVRESIHVVLIDASASLTEAARESARLESIYPPVGIVAVSENPQTGLTALPVLPKWTAFPGVFDAIDTARRESTREGAPSDVR